MWMIVSTIILGLIGVGWSIPFILLPLVGCSLHVITDKVKVDAIFNNIKKIKTYSSIMNHTRGKDQSSGFITGRWFVGYIREIKGNERGEPVTEISLIVSNARYELLIKKESNKKTDRNSV